MTELQSRLQNVDLAALRASDFAVVHEAAEAWNTPQHALIMSDNIALHAEKAASLLGFLHLSGFDLQAITARSRPSGSDDFTAFLALLPEPRRPAQPAQPADVEQLQALFSDPPRAQQPQRYRFGPAPPQQPAPPSQHPLRQPLVPPPPQSLSQATPSKLQLLFGRPLNLNLLAEVATFLNLTFQQEHFASTTDSASQQAAVSRLLSEVGVDDAACAAAATSPLDVHCLIQDAVANYRRALRQQLQQQSTLHQLSHHALPPAGPPASGNVVTYVGPISDDISETNATSHQALLTLSQDQSCMDALGFLQRAPYSQLQASLAALPAAVKVCLTTNSVDHQNLQFHPQVTQIAASKSAIRAHFRTFFSETLGLEDAPLRGNLINALLHGRYTTAAHIGVFVVAPPPIGSKTKPTPFDVFSTNLLSQPNAQQIFIAGVAFQFACFKALWDQWPSGDVGRGLDACERFFTTAVLGFGADGPIALKDQLLIVKVLQQYFEDYHDEQS